MEEELKFPLEFTRCPNCNGTKRLAETILEQEKRKGKVREEAKTAIFNSPPIIIADPTRVILSAPTIIARFDVCIEKRDDGTLCGTFYCIRADLGTATPGPPPGKGQGMKGFGFPQNQPNLS